MPRPTAKRLRAILLRAGAILLLGTLPAQAQKTAPAIEASPAATPVASVPLTDIADQAQTTITRVNGIATDGPADEKVAVTRQALTDLTTRVNQWLTEANKTLNGRPSLDALRDLDSGGHQVNEALNDGAATLNDRAKTLEAAGGQLQSDLTLWTATGDAARKAGAPAETLALCQNVLDAVKNATTRLKDRRRGVLELQSQFSALTGKLTTGLDSVRLANDAALKALFVRDSAPLWQQRAAPARNPVEAAPDPAAQQAAAAWTYTQSHLDLLAFQALVILCLLGLLLWLKRGLHTWVEEEPHLKRAAPIFEVPVATAIALSFLASGWLYAASPLFFRAATGAVGLLPTIVLLRRLVDVRLRPALYFLFVFYFVGETRTVLTAYPLLNRWVFVAEMLAAILVFWWVGVTKAQPAEGEAGAVLGTGARLLCRLAIVLFAAALLAEVLGFVGLGEKLGSAVFQSSYVAIFFYALIQVLRGLSLIALRVRPLSISHIARNHHAEVHTKISRFLRLAAFAGWFWLTLDFFRVQAPFQDGVLHALAYHLHAGSVDLSVGKLLGFGVAIWLSLLVSRLIRFFLEEEVFERVHLTAGLPYAIATILNYLVIFIGFLIALGVLGVDLASVTILAGAFSVGLGFGLQNIINNFVSGVILLFERPVKVGDVIQIGDAVGEVRRIGIRASIIGTREGSSIIVPNGNLISNQFTNWTYADRHRSVEVALSLIGVADPNRTLNLLKAAAAAHTATKDHPAPEAYLTSLTGTGMGVVVRAWISHYEDWVQTRSELTVSLAEVLARENIKLA